MTARLSPFGEFVALFNNVKYAAGNSPERFEIKYRNNELVRQAYDALQNFLHRYDFERQVFHGRRKQFPQIPASFEAAWKEYVKDWRFRVSDPDDVFVEWMEYVFLCEIENKKPDPNREAAFRERCRKEARVEPVEPESATATPLAPPDPKIEASFDPRKHDGGTAIELGIEYLEASPSSRLDLEGSGLEEEPEWENRSTLALGAYDYLTNGIGLNVHDVFRRWREVPVVFMPTHVSNSYGASDKGSLVHLLNEAVRAYVFGAPGAAIAMCRAALEMILKKHYGDGDWEDPKKSLSKVIAAASKRYEFIRADELTEFKNRADAIMHRYSQEYIISKEDERTILMFLATLKSLVEDAER